jgi:hypothetical protein
MIFLGQNFAQCPKWYEMKFRLIWGRCYDFKNIFAEKLGKKMAFYYSKQS